MLDAASGARADAGPILAGGSRLYGHGLFREPALVADAQPSALLALEEVFGPIRLLQNMDSTLVALQLANGTDSGLAAAVFKSDLARAGNFAPRFEAGVVRINAPTTGVDLPVPFGGDQASRHGRRGQGRAARKFLSSTATLRVAPTPRPVG